MTLISELLDLPDVVNRGDFVLKLTEGITDEQAQATLQHYGVTESLKKNFDDALRFIKGRWSRAAARAPTCTAASPVARAISWRCSTCC